MPTLDPPNPLSLPDLPKCVHRVLTAVEYPPILATRSSKQQKRTHHNPLPLLKARPPQDQVHQTEAPAVVLPPSLYVTLALNLCPVLAPQAAHHLQADSAQTQYQSLVLVQGVVCHHQTQWDEEGCRRHSYKQDKEEVCLRHKECMHLDLADLVGRCRHKGILDLEGEVRRQGKGCMRLDLEEEALRRRVLQGGSKTDAARVLLVWFCWVLLVRLWVWILFLSSIAIGQTSLLLSFDLAILSF